jgi:type IV pilus assembly protein PilQ
MYITFSFNGVPYSEAFRYLLRSAGLDYKVQNGMLIVARPESLIRVLGNEVTRVYRLAYAIDESGQVRSDLTGTLTGLISLPQPPVLDAPNREIYVTTSPEQHREVEALLERLDKPGRQIMLEAKIFEVSDNGKQDLETLVTGIYNHWVASFTGGGLNLGYTYSNREWESGSPSGWNLPIGGTITDSPVLDYFPMEGTRMLSAGLRALETKGVGKTIANPSVITMDGQKASVNLQTSMSYASGVDSSGNPVISTVSSGPALNFLPVVGRDGLVTIGITIEASILTGWRNAGMGAQTPVISNRQVDTTVRVRNGEPFVVGGLYQEIRNQERRRIPVLGYIPLLGDLFSFRMDEHTKSEVAMIVIPYILDVPDGGIETFDLRRMSRF